MHNFFLAVRGSRLGLDKSHNAFLLSGQWVSPRLDKYLHFAILHSSFFIYMIDQILTFNREFVATKGYEKYLTDKYPDKRLAVLSCMDTRLTELLPAALGLRNGDAKIIKNAGGLVISPFDSAMRSLIVAIYELGAPESVRTTVRTIKSHPLVPKDIVVRGFIIDSATGELKEVE